MFWLNSIGGLKRVGKSQSLFHFPIDSQLISPWLLSSRSEYVDQTVADIASYYGYNQFLAEKLFLLFPVNEVSLDGLNGLALLLSLPSRPSSSSNLTKILDL